MKIKFFLLALFLTAACYRTSFVNHPFWVDEFSSAIQARLINTYGLVNFFKQTDYYAEPNNILPHILIANSFRYLGETESAARLPFMIIGSFVPIAVFLVARLLFDTPTGIISSFLATTSYFMITWSRQARGYPLQQLLVLLLIFSYVQHKKTKEIKWLIYLTITAVIGVFTHYLITLLVGLIVVLFVIENKHSIKKYWLPIMATLLFVGVGAYFTKILQNASITFFNTIITQSTNNLWYYHSLLWRQETVITLLAGIGVVWAYSLHSKYLWQLLLIITFLLSLVVFIIPGYSSRYLLLIYPLLLIFASYTIVKISSVVMKNLKLVGLTTPLSIAFSFVIIASGHMFTIKPLPYYSVNHVMRDIALVDYNQVYAEIIDARIFYSDIAVVDTWADRAHWYLGQDYESLYWFRWLDENGSINGLPQKTNVLTTSTGELVVPMSGPRLIPLISSQADLERVMRTHKYGYIWIDDTSMSTDIINYAKNNLRQVIHVDHYQFDDNPYSIWPGTLYSWGINPANVSATPAQP